MSAKSELNKIEKRMERQDPQDNNFEVSWRVDGMCEWRCDDGSIEMITPDEFKRRGGILLSWSDDDYRGDQL